MSARGFFWGVAAAIATATGCATDIPGVAPPADQLHFPVGLAFVEGSSPDRDVLVVGNTNFDQLYNAGSLIALPVDQLVAALPAAGSAGTAYVTSLPASANRVRIHQFAGDLVVVPSASRGRARLYTPVRAENRLIMAEVSDGVLSCTSGVDTVPGLDCSRAYMAPTGGIDPYSLALLPAIPGPLSAGGRDGFLAIGHLQATIDVNGFYVAPVGLLRIGSSTATPDGFDLRIANEKKGIDPDVAPGSPVQTSSSSLSQLGGITGLAFIGSSTAAKERARLVITGRHAGINTIPTPVSVFGLREDLPGDTATACYAAPADIHGPLACLKAGPSLRLESIANVIDLRGAAISPDGRRAYASVRFAGFGGRTTSGIAVVSLDRSGTLSLLSLTEVGDLVGRPVLRSVGNRRLLYVPDTRLDQIFILDASTDELTIAGAIAGRADRIDASGKTVNAHVLAGPAGLVFLERGGRTLGFVSNFSNSTLAVIDVSSADPTQHRVVARIGRARSPGNAEEEGP